MFPYIRSVNLQIATAWHYSKLHFSNDMLYGKLSVLPDNRYKFLTTKPKDGNSYIKNKKPNESHVLEEVHLYVSDSVVPHQYDSGGVKIAYSTIQNAEVYVNAKGQINTSWLVPAIGGPVIAGWIIAVIAVLVNDPLGIGGHGSFSHKQHPILCIQSHYCLFENRQRESVF